jgi:hypothetical protein
MLPRLSLCTRLYNGFNRFTRLLELDKPCIKLDPDVLMTPDVIQHNTSDIMLSQLDHWVTRHAIELSKHLTAGLSPR